MIRLVLITVLSAGVASAETPKLGRILSAADDKACEREGDIARGILALKATGTSEENALVMLADAVGDDKIETIAKINNQMKDFGIQSGEVATRVFEALCIKDRLGPIDILAK